ncbi:MAG: hypothetical protein ACRCS3_07810 [Paracoccaceae bacterium]
MKPMKLALMAALFVAGCDGNPFGIDRDVDGGGPPGVDGTPDARPNRAVTRVEERVEGGENNGNGYAEGFIYDAENDTFEVDGLAFDGANVYTRDNNVASLGPYEVYESANTFEDSETGVVINQFLHRAIQGQSTNVGASGVPNTRFAIVRTGAYVPYGFGGFLYERNGRVSIPSAGQAGYSGEYAGLRDFSGAGGLEYVTGDVNVAIDFEDFNDSDGLIGDGVRGEVFNRRVFALNGRDITSEIIRAINENVAAPGAQLDPDGPLPALIFQVGPGVMSEAGEIAGQLNSNVVTESGIEVFETGNYYAILADSPTLPAGELVGIVVVTADDPRFQNAGVTVRETGGFIAYRP